MNQRDYFLSDFDLHLLMEGNHLRAWEKLGAHLDEINGEEGARFALWAPNAEKVSVVGDFNNWNMDGPNLSNRGDSGVWEGFVSGIKKGALYKYAVKSQYNGYAAQKADPYGFMAEVRPKSASVVWDLSEYAWGDGEWMRNMARRNSLESPISIYEVHLGSWMRRENGWEWLTYRDVAPKLAEYVKEMGFTHVEFLPLTEHPLDESWGYQTIGYFSPTSRFGDPDDFMFLVDILHQNGIGVIMDWAPGHFPRDEHGLSFFDGSHLYEHADPRQREHQDWGTLIFNFGRREVSNYLLCSALFWLETYHLDGLRVDAVASMLYNDYSRSGNDWTPNQFGGRENLEAVEFLKKLNKVVYEKHPGVIMIAEESTAWPMVSRPTYSGGLGFGLKWNMGWMHDMLNYMTQDPIHRKHRHNDLTFSLLYAFHENFILPFSHDEVCHGEGSMLGKMPGDEWQRFANLRVLYGYMFAHPGKKLLFMGNEFGHCPEWNPRWSLEWFVLQYSVHSGLQSWVKDLNKILKDEPALHEVDFDPSGFEWIHCDDRDNSVISFIRRSKNSGRIIMCVCNFTPTPRENYRIGAPIGGRWEEVLNSDDAVYGGSGMGNSSGLDAGAEGMSGRPYSIALTLPPLSTLYLKPASG